MFKYDIYCFIQFINPPISNLNYLPAQTHAYTHTPLQLLHLCHLRLPTEFWLGMQPLTNWMPPLHTGLWLWPCEMPLPAACDRTTELPVACLTLKREETPQRVFDFYVQLNTHKDADPSAKSGGSIALRGYLFCISPLSVQTNSWISKRNSEASSNMFNQIKPFRLF